MQTRHIFVFDKDSNTNLRPHLPRSPNSLRSLEHVRFDAFYEPATKPKKRSNNFALAIYTLTHKRLPRSHQCNGAFSAWYFIICSASKTSALVTILYFCNEYAHASERRSGRMPNAHSDTSECARRALVRAPPSSWNAFIFIREVHRLSRCRASRNRTR